MMTMSPAHVMTATSRFLTWASSCPRTASTSRSLRRESRPLRYGYHGVLGLRPVAKALGTWVSMIAIFLGLGISYIWARRSMVAWSQGSSWTDTSRAPVDMRTSLSDMKYWMRDADEGESEYEDGGDAGEEEHPHEDDPDAGEHEYGEGHAEG